jgi:hypothetical protein
MKVAVEIGSAGVNLRMPDNGAAASLDLRLNLHDGVLQFAG